MEPFMKKKWLMPVAAIGIVAAVALLVYALLFDVTYASIKDCGTKPPFDGVHWGMTKEEFCKAMDIDESALVPAEPLKYDDWQGDLQNVLETSFATAEELPLFEWQENQYYLSMIDPIFGENNFFVDDKPLTIRVIFTNETTYKGKTIPPLLCTILFKIRKGTELAFGNQAELFYNGEIMDEDQYFGGQSVGMAGNVHDEAEILSYLYTAGANPEEIERIDYESLGEQERLELWNGVRRNVFVQVRRDNPWINIQGKIDVNNQHPEWDTESIYVTIDAGYMAYYEWFLNELT